VALAAKDGANFLEPQLLSILPQLSSQDELVVSIDTSAHSSSDRSLDIVLQLVKDWPQLRAITGPGRGIQANFESAIAATSGDVVFLSDHDDIWMPNKVEAVLAAFQESRATLVLHDAEVVDSELNTIAASFFRQRNSRPGYLRNLLKNSYIGCCMAFLSSLKPLVLPFPPQIPMHDQWLGLLAERTGTVCFLEQPLILYRRHGSNATAMSHAGPGQMLLWRWQMLRALQGRVGQRRAGYCE
jgi:glycosyltransferase involved in cell wall biosynthesis